LGEKTMPKIKIKIADYIIIGAIFFWGFTGFWFNLQSVSAAEQKYAAVYVENQQIAELSLVPGDQFSYTFSFGENDEHSAVIEIEDGRIRMLPLDDHVCPKQICSHTGWISFSYESIVCLPNQIMVVFSEAGPENGLEGIDGITY
jgi:hypothetical protein